MVTTRSARLCLHCMDVGEMENRGAVGGGLVESFSDVDRAVLGSWADVD